MLGSWLFEQRWVACLRWVDTVMSGPAAHLQSGRGGVGRVSDCTILGHLEEAQMLKGAPQSVSSPCCGLLQSNLMGTAMTSPLRKPDH